jgi:hypothetical protein
MPFHLLTLLATEKRDVKHINDEQVSNLAKQLTHLLLEKPEHNDRTNTDKAYGWKPA